MNLPYQRHSETSREAAETNVTAGKMRNLFYDRVKASGARGCTMDEARTYLLARGLIRDNTLPSPRFRELETSGLIIKTAETRLTVSNRPANVYVTKEIFAAGGFRAAETKEASEATRLKLRIAQLEGTMDGILQAIEKDGLVKIAQNSTRHEALMRVRRGA